MCPEPKKHHYLPVFYLKGFCDPHSPDLEKPDLWVYAQGQAPRRSTPANEGYEKQANTLILPDGSRDLSVELGLAAQVDGPAAPVIRKLDAGPVDLSTDEIGNLARFAGFLFSRTPTGRYVSEHVSGPVADKIIKRAAQTQEEFTEFLQRQLGEIPPNTEQLRQEALAGIGGDSKELSLLSMIDIAGRYAEHLNKSN